MVDPGVPFEFAFVGVGCPGRGSLGRWGRIAYMFELGAFLVRKVGDVVLVVGGGVKRGEALWVVEGRGTKKWLREEGEVTGR